MSRDLVHRADPEPEAVHLDPSSLDRAVALVASTHGFDPEVIHPRVKASLLARRAQEVGLRVEEYLARLEGSPEEVATLARAFFRNGDDHGLDPQLVRHLVTLVSPPPGREILRVWLVGSARIDDAHRVALELLVHHGLDPESLIVFATDLDERVLARSGQARLDASFVAELPPGAERFLVEAEDGYTLKAQLRSRMAFAIHDLLRTPPFGKIDLLVCGQPLHYLAPDPRERAVERLAFALEPGGIAAVRPGVALDEWHADIEALDLEHGLFRKKRTAPRARALRPRLGPDRLVEAVRRSRAMERAFALSYGATGTAAAVVDGHGQVAVILSTGRDLIQAPKGWNPRALQARIDPRLEGPLNRALRAARGSDSPVHREALEIASGRLVDLSVAPIGEGELLVEIRPRRPLRPAEGESPLAERVRELEEELLQVRSELEEAVAALEAGNDRLSEANQGLQATNEQLRDAHQELESRNHELRLENDRLERRIEALEALGTEANALFESGDVAALFLGPDAKVWRASPGVTALIGYEPVIGGELSAAVLGKEVMDAVEGVLSGRGPVEIERPIRGLHVLVRVLPRNLERTIGPGAVVTLTDLSSVWRHTVAAETQARQLAALFETADDPTFELSIRGEITYANTAARTLLGLAEGSGGSFVAALAAAGASEPEAVREMIEGARHGLRRPRVSVSFPSTGQVFDFAARPLYEEGRVARMVVAARDMTELDASQREVHASRALMQAVLDSLEAAIAVVDHEGQVVMHNHAWRRSRDRSFPGAKAETGRSLLEQLEIEEAEGREEAGMVASYLRLVVDGRGPGEACRYPIRDGTETRHIETTATSLSHAGRQLVVVVQDDITSVRLAEQQRLEVQAKLLDADKLESLGVLAGGVAHDFNNLLVGILSNASFVLDQSEAGSLAFECLKDVELAAERAAELCQQLLAFSGRGKFQLQEVRLDAVVNDSLRLLQASISRDISLDVALPERALPPVEADISQLRQVLFNLVTNGAEAIGQDAGTVRVELGVDWLDGGRVQRASHAEGAKPGRYVYLRVSDDGAGMTEAVRARIFEPFFSTKFTGRGLGLAAVQGIVHGHGGVLEVDTAPDMGTTMTAWFPVLAEDEPITQPTVLVVDDEDMVRSAASRALARAGYRVLEASNGPAAVSLFAEEASRVALVLLDVTMPGMSGEAVYLRIRSLRRSVPVLFSSGLPELADRGLLAPEDRTFFIQKPYRSSALVERVASILERSGPET